MQGAILRERRVGNKLRMDESAAVLKAALSS